jgi:hypothetical protein
LILGIEPHLTENRRSSCQGHLPQRTSPPFAAQPCKLLTICSRTGSSTTPRRSSRTRACTRVRLVTQNDALRETGRLTAQSSSTPESTPRSPSATSCPSTPFLRAPSSPTSRTRPLTVVRSVAPRATTLPSSATTLTRARPVSSSRPAPRRSSLAHAVVWSASSLEVAAQTNPS